MIYGIVGKKQSGKNTVAKIWGIFDFYYKMGKDYWVKYAAINGKIKKFTDIDYVLNNLQFENKNSNWQEKSFAHSLKKILCILYGFKIEDFESEEFKSKELPEQFWYWYMELDGGYGPIILPYTTPKSPKGYEGLKLIKPTPRMLLQKIGTDLFRNQLHPLVWINATMADYIPDEGYSYNVKPTGNIGFDGSIELKVLSEPEKYNNGYPNWIITDVRFQNEADAVTERGGRLIKVIRYKVGDKVWFNDESEPDEDKNQSGEYEIIGIHSNEEYLISNGTTEMGAWNYEINHINKDTHTSEVEQDSISVHYTIHNSTTIEDLIKQVKYIMIEEGVINE